MPRYSTYAELSIIHEAEDDEEASDQSMSILAQIVELLNDVDCVTADSDVVAALRRVPDTLVPLTIFDLDFKL